LEYSVKTHRGGSKKKKMNGSRCGVCVYLPACEQTEIQRKKNSVVDTSTNNKETKKCRVWKLSYKNPNYYGR
jgi:hypothetical protein